MKPHRPSRGASLLPAAAACVIAILAAVAHAQESRLGAVDFPTSARSAEAQAHFLRGVAALHSFWYPVALDEFRAATRIEPDFTMGYWGEAMARNHPIWGDPQETEAARAVLAKIHATPELTPREQAYLDAVKRLYGPGDKAARDRAYADAMEEIYRDYPHDLEAAAFYSLALLGTAYSSPSPDATAPNDPAALRTRMRAAAVAQEVYRKEPDHPGAPHYILHAFDDPNHAILALPAARRYAEIAPAAPHALHMPSHIFLQLGMWSEAAASNEASWKASVELGEPNFHGLHWLLYAYLQQGRYDGAEPLLATMQQRLAELPAGDPMMRAYGAYTAATMAATFVVESERWDQAGRLLPAPSEHAAEGQAGGGADPSRAFKALALSPAVFARGLAAATTGAADAQQSIAALQAARRQIAGIAIPFVARLDPVLRIQALEIAAAASAAKHDFDAAIRTMEQATALTEATPPPPGPPPAIKPPHELFGEILLAAGRPEAAGRHFATSLFRHPDRALSLLGAARAAVRAGNGDKAASAYAKLLRQWQPADETLPALREARDYLKSASVRSP